MKLGTRLLVFSSIFLVTLPLLGLLLYREDRRITAAGAGGSPVDDRVGTGNGREGLY
jgi:hypothetical protein